MSLLDAILWITLNIYHEARSEPFLGQKAIAHVVYNRAENRDLSVEAVIREPLQFSWVHQKKDYWPDDWTAVHIALKAAAEAANEEDFTGGATYYHHESVSPAWVFDMEYLGTYGTHLFYKKYTIVVLRPQSKKIKPLYAQTNNILE